MLDRLDREELPGTLMFVDLDNFKAVNDQLRPRGRRRGAVRSAPRLLRNLVRPTDLVARLGGDEFAVWLNGADHMRPPSAPSTCAWTGRARSRRSRPDRACR